MIRCGIYCVSKYVYLRRGVCRQTHLDLIVSLLEVSELPARTIDDRKLNFIKGKLEYEA